MGKAGDTVLAPRFQAKFFMRFRVAPQGVARGFQGAGKGRFFALSDSPGGDAEMHA
jgi:hypothetical protein